MRNFLWCLAAVSALSSAACSTYLAPVTGKVTYKGAPAAGATVLFYRQTADSESDPLVAGTVQADGSFELACGASGKGAPPGQYDVLVVWRSPTPCACGRATPAAGGRPERVADKLNGRYADRQNPRFRVIVKDEPNELAPFELSD